MRKRTLGVWFILAALLIMQIPIPEADAATSASDFKIDGNMLVSYSGTEKEVVVPDTVVVIGESAFENNDFVEKVVLPNTVEEINEYAFWGCDNLKTVSLGKKIKQVGDYAFANCVGLEIMTIPSSVLYIGLGSFVNCVNLEKITIPYNTIGIHETAFDGCPKLKIDAVEGTYAFNYAIDLYERQKEMAEYQDVPDYDNSSDDSVDADESGDGDFEKDYVYSEGEISSTKVVNNNAVIFIDNTHLEVLDAYEAQDSESDCDSQNSLTDSIINSQNGLAKYTVVDERIIADHAYYKNKTINTIDIPGNINEVGQFSFARSNIESLVISQGVELIDYGAFYHCDNLEKISLPDSIKNIEPKAFEQTPYFENTDNYTEEGFLINNGILLNYIGQEKDVDVPDTVRLIASESFKANNFIKTVNLPDSVIYVGEGAFEDCINLSEVNLGNSIYSIKDRAFHNTSLTEVSLPDSLSELGRFAFDDNVSDSFDKNKYTLTHEVSAERLSNYSYRNNSETGSDKVDSDKLDSGIGIKVNGPEDIFAFLPGINDYYYLNIKEISAESMDSAYYRTFEKHLDEECKCYEITLTDDSNIPITKLGKQTLEISMPIPVSLEGMNFNVYLTDRNGQLENVEYTRGLSDNREVVVIKINYISNLCFVSDGTQYLDELKTVNININSQAQNISSSADKNIFKLINYIRNAAALIVFASGIGFILKLFK